MPLDVVEPDLQAGRLVEIRLEDATSQRNVMAMSAFHRSDTPPGPAGRWLIDRLKQVSGASGLASDVTLA